MDGVFEMNPAQGIYSRERKPRRKARTALSVQAEKDERRMRKEDRLMKKQMKDAIVQAAKDERRMRKEKRERYIKVGRILGAAFKTPNPKRTRLVRKQGGTGLKSLMRKNSKFHGSMASLIKYAKMQQQKQQAAYLKRTGRSAVHIRMTNEEKKAKRAAAYKEKKRMAMAAAAEAAAQAVTLANITALSQPRPQVVSPQVVSSRTRARARKPPSPPRARVVTRAARAARERAGLAL